MARQSRRKKNGVFGTLLVELSALAGIFGVAQPTVRNNLWQMIQPPTINSQLNQAPPPIDQYVSEPELFTPSYVPEPYTPNYPSASPSTYPSAYTAQVVPPSVPGNPAAWNPSGYNPMGTYQ